MNSKVNRGQIWVGIKEIQLSKKDWTHKISEYFKNMFARIWLLLELK